MNARDNIKPKSIRLAILIALADGEITTIDDLLLKVDEPRKKVVENAAAAANDGLLKRMRDDVTSQAAYQILPAGKKYLAKYADGSKSEPTPAAESDEVDKEVGRRIQKIVAVAPETKKAEAVAVKVLEESMPGFSAEVIAQKDTEIASLSRRLRDAFADVDRMNKELEAANASLELARMARTVVHAGYVIQRPVKPLARFSKIENAKARALACARGGKKAQVFALVPVGLATPGAEWVAA